MANVAELARRALQPFWRSASAVTMRPLNLALQGGGAHGAFTWGVLDRLLADGRVAIHSVSGTSAGAVNAVALAAGFAEGGPAGARATLEAVWRAVAKARTPYPRATWLAFDVMSRLFSPYHLNPLDYDPLRDVLSRTIDFGLLAGSGAPRLFVAATEVASGRARIFGPSEITLDVVLASACLPALSRAVRIDGRHYWDGGFSANPAIMPLVLAPGAEDTLIVQLDPLRAAELPIAAQDIIGQVNRITFNQPLLREIELIEQGRRLARQGLGFGREARRRLRRHRFHLIEAARYTADLDRLSKLDADWTVLRYLRDGGRASASAWLERHLPAVGRRASVDLTKRFLADAT